MRLAILATALSSAVVGLALADPAAAAIKTPINIAPQELDSALRVLAAERHLQILYTTATVANRHTSGAVGEFTVAEALMRLLGGTGLVYRYIDDNTITIMPQGESAPTSFLSSEGTGVGGDERKSFWSRLRLAQNDTAAPRSAAGGGAVATDENDQRVAESQREDSAQSRKTPALEEIVVTGTHIAGTAPASAVLQITAQQMREAGQRDLGEVVRSLPLNFGGGQNPAVAVNANVGSVANQNSTGGSALNLRGIGPDATLTLLNGRRLTYDSFSQAVDISTIPLDAVSSIQIVPDGASALYGSDAVAGVANVILKKDYSGASASVRLGEATDGGGFRQEYGLVAGTKWDAGGFLVALQNANADQISTNQRDYTRYLPSFDLTSPEHSDNALVTAHHDLTDNVTLGVDALYGKRKSSRDFFDSLTSSSLQQRDSESYSVSPSLTVQLSPEWSGTLYGFYGHNDTHSDNYTRNLSVGSVSHSVGCFCNKAKAAELGANGPLFAISGGDVRLALGAGYRQNGFESTQRSATLTSAFVGKRDNYYGYSELNVPLVSEANSRPGVHSLSVSGAFRYEHYDGSIGSVTTPKFGLIYAPTRDLDLKASWGKSFKAPTLYQQYSPLSAFLYPARLLGGTQFPVGSTVMALIGGNQNLDPERATTWSATLGLHPHALEGLNVEVTAFHVDYRDRVLLPVALATTFVNPAYQPFIDSTPTAAEQAAVIARASAGLINGAGAPYDPAAVAAIVNDLYTNVARQRIHGVDLTSRYRIDLATGTLAFDGQGSWLSSDQQSLSGSQPFALDGILFNPPHFRARAGATYRANAFTAAAFVNYIGPVTDNRAAPAVKGESMTTADLTLMYRPDAQFPLLRDVDLSLSVNNVTNETPPLLRSLGLTYVNYDSTNYSPVGRYVSLFASKHW